MLRRFEEAGLDVRACKMARLSEDILREHYAHLVALPFFPDILAFMRSTPVIALALSGENAIGRVREMVGPTDSQAAPQGTIRGDMGTDKMRNIVHASDGADTAAAELKRFFSEDEVF